jgi:hypothetical protein
MRWLVSTRVNINQKVILQNKLRSIEMAKSDTIIGYLMKVTQVRDQLPIVGQRVAYAQLVKMALNGFPSSWELLSPTFGDN